MTPQQAIEVLETVIDASISDPAKRETLKAELIRVFEERHQVPAKGILADCEKFGDRTISPEIGELIKEVCFYYV